jgi:pimeloyl-ACP methyl ester carboxylesterase
MNRRKLLEFGARLPALVLAGCAGADRADSAMAASPSSPAGFRAGRRFLRTRLGEIAYVARGSGAAALFLHGFPLNGYQWRGVIERLAPMRTCIVPDFLGMGVSRAAAGQAVGPQAQVEMLLALLEHLGVEQADVIANDSGGAVAQLLAARHPARVRSLLLTNCDTEIESPPAAMLPVIELARRGEFVSQWLAPWARDPALARSEQGIGGMCYANPAHPTDEAVHMYFAPLLESTERRRQLHDYAVALGKNALAGIRPALRACRVPTRIAWGGDDTIFSARSAHYLANSFGNFRGLRVLAKARLFWPEERPDVLAAQARLLWESVQFRRGAAGGASARGPAAAA